MNTKNIVGSLTTMKLVKTFFQPLLEIRNLIKESNGERISFLSIDERSFLLNNPEIQRVEVICFNTISVRSILKYEFLAPIWLELFHYGKDGFNDQYVEIVESNVGKNAFQILERRNPNYDRSKLNELLNLFNCKEMGVSVGLRLNWPYSIDDIVSGINNVAHCCFDISNL